jgi:hypothetical protein
MSIHSDIVDALGYTNVANGNVYPDAAPETALPPLVIYRRSVYDPLMTLQGPEGTARSEFVFECWGAKSAVQTAKASALALASEVRNAIESSVDIWSKYELTATGEQFEQETLEMMEPVIYSFWHADR